MIKNLIRHIAITLTSFYVTSLYLVSGFFIPLNLFTYAKIVVIFSLLTLIVRPILKILFLPINFLTLGLLGWLINVILLYLLVAFVPEVHFGVTTYPAFSWEQVFLPSIKLTPLWTAVATSISLTALNRTLKWLASK